MLFSNIYERYVPALNCPEVDIKSSIVFMADSDKLLMKSDKEDILFPCLDDFNPDLFSSEETEFSDFWTPSTVFACHMTGAVLFLKDLDFKAFGPYSAESMKIPF